HRPQGDIRLDRTHALVREDVNTRRHEPPPTHMRVFNVLPNEHHRRRTTDNHPAGATRITTPRRRRGTQAPDARPAADPRSTAHPPAGQEGRRALPPRHTIGTLPHTAARLL